MAEGIQNFNGDVQKILKFVQQPQYLKTANTMDTRYGYMPSTNMNSAARVSSVFSLFTSFVFILMF